MRYLKATEIKSKQNMDAYAHTTRLFVIWTQTDIITCKTKRFTADDYHASHTVDSCQNHIKYYILDRCK